MKITIEDRVIDDQSDEVIDNTENWFRISAVLEPDGVTVKVRIQEVTGNVHDPTEVNGVKQEVFDFANKNNLKTYVDNL